MAKKASKGIDEPSLTTLTAVILAGGFGTRLRSVIADRPKALAEVRGRPFLAYVLDQIAAAGFNLVVLCTGYMGEQVRATFGDTYENLHLAYSQEVSPLGTAGALRLALPLVTSDPVLVMNGDSFCEANLRTFRAWHGAQGAAGTLLLSKTLDTRRYGQVEVDANGVIWRFAEKGSRSEAGWINAGIYLLTRHLLHTIPVNSAVSLEREMFPVWSSRGLYGYRSEGRFLDIGTPEAYATAEQFFATSDLSSSIRSA
jgi:D-glycero-alpha-D-manno-heptose 1-phosphate guanylyltransferase